MKQLIRQLLEWLIAYLRSQGNTSVNGGATPQVERKPGGDRPQTDRSATDRFEYAPHSDGEPDAGEVCWAWVPFEEDASQGKDRPVLILGRRGRAYLAVALTSKDRADDGEVREDRYGNIWLDIGSGDWDGQGRRSEVRVDRLLVLDEVRREGAAVNRATYERVIALGRKHW
ncbi:MAG: type II toxin-antitoxin system PemK/MazF family toxin [Aeromicrobium sp.]|uniref:type II toxin-antitoxin system PemK/MazF family toxin n=1 Tax=Aeromicrobium sp. TaxID=1871063 RepID=UPI0039E5B3D0